MTKKKNDPDAKLIRFPTLAERDRLRKAQNAPEKPRRRSGKPFFNFSKIPHCTRALVIAFIAVHLILQFLVDKETLYSIYLTLGFVPANFTHGLAAFPPLAALSPVTYLFIHGSWTHLLFNVLMMFAMGAYFEREFGPRLTAFIFFACGIAGAAASLAFNPFSTAPIIGASAGITGLFGAVTILMFQRGMTRFGQSKSELPLIAFWVALMVGMGLLSGDFLAWQAHVGGFLAGIGLLHLIQKRKTGLRR